MCSVGKGGGLTRKQLHWLLNAVVLRNQGQAGGGRRGKECAWRTEKTEQQAERKGAGDSHSAILLFFSFFSSHLCCVLCVEVERGKDKGEITRNTSQKWCSEEQSGNRREGVRREKSKTEVKYRISAHSPSG